MLLCERGGGLVAHREVLLVRLPSEQQFDRLDVLLADRVQQCVADLDAVAQQQLDHLDVLVLDRDQQRGAAERVAAVHVDVEVDLRLFERGARPRDVGALHRQQELLLLVVQVRLVADQAGAESGEVGDGARGVDRALRGGVAAAGAGVGGGGQLVAQLLRVQLRLLVLTVDVPVHGACNTHATAALTGLDAASVSAGIKIIHLAKFVSVTRFPHESSLNWKKRAQILFSQFSAKFANDDRTSHSVNPGDVFLRVR